MHAPPKRERAIPAQGNGLFQSKLLSFCFELFKWQNFLNIESLLLYAAMISQDETKVSIFLSIFLYKNNITQVKRC